MTFRVFLLLFNVKMGLIWQEKYLRVKKFLHWVKSMFDTGEIKIIKMDLIERLVFKPRQDKCTNLYSGFTKKPYLFSPFPMTTTCSHSQELRQKRRQQVIKYDFTVPLLLVQFPVMKCRIRTALDWIRLLNVSPLHWCPCRPYLFVLAKNALKAFFTLFPLPVQ